MTAEQQEWLWGVARYLGQECLNANLFKHPAMQLISCCSGIRLGREVNVDDRMLRLRVPTEHARDMFHNAPQPRLARHRVPPRRGVAMRKDNGRDGRQMITRRVMGTADSGWKRPLGSRRVILADLDIRRGKDDGR